MADADAEHLQQVENELRDLFKEKKDSKLTSLFNEYKEVHQIVIDDVIKGFEDDIQSLNQELANRKGSKRGKGEDDGNWEAEKRWDAEREQLENDKTKLKDDNQDLKNKLELEKKECKKLKEAKAKAEDELKSYKEILAQENKKKQDQRAAVSDVRKETKDWQMKYDSELGNFFMAWFNYFM